MFDSLSFVQHRPRVQIIRGLPGSGKSTLAKQYPCLHLETDQFCCRGGAYRWGEQRDADAHKWLDILVHRHMKEGLDLVVTGVMPVLHHLFGKIVYWAMKCGYDAWAYEATGDYGNLHNVRMSDLDRMQRTFEPLDLETLATPNRYSKDPMHIRLSVGEYEQFGAFCRERLNVGLMPKEYPCEPEMDGLGS